MIKTCANAAIFILLATIFYSCKKQSNEPANNDNTFLFSVNTLLAIQGASWNSVEPMLSNKRGYWYTEFTQDQNIGIKAAISLPAYDTSNGLKINCNILLNVARSSNKVVAEIMGTNDTLSPLTREQAFALESYYYTYGFKPMTDTTNTYGFYDDGTGFQRPISISEAFLKLNSNYDTPALGMYYRTTTPYSDYTIVCFKNMDNDRYTFSYRGSD